MLYVPFIYTSMDRVFVVCLLCYVILCGSENDANKALKRF